MNSIASIATVATEPCASREATMPAAISIWLSTQPPKIWPLALMSPGPGTTRRIGSPLVALVVIQPSPRGVLVETGPVADEEQAHQPGADQDGEADPRDGRDQHVDRERLARPLQVDQRPQHGCDG